MITMRYALKNYGPFIFPIIGGVFGWYLDLQEALRLTKYRDKSALYGRELAPGEPPSWP